MVFLKAFLPLATSPNLPSWGFLRFMDYALRNAIERGETLNAKT